MPKNISRRELIQRFRLFGFNGPFAGGRHLFMIKGDLKIHIPNPHGKDISGPLVREILKQANIPAKKWDDSK